MLVTVANFTEPWEAHMFRMRLQAEGMLAFVAHGEHVTNNWPIGLALGGAKVQVLEDDAERARAIERDAIAGHYRAELNKMFDQSAEACPRCGMADFSERGPLAHVLLDVVSTLWAGAAFPVAQEKRRCRNCKTEWRRELPD